MNAETTLSKIMTYLGMENQPEKVEENVVEVKFEQRKQAEGDVVFESDSFAPGDAVFVLTEDGERIPAPEGHYAMEDGNVMMVNDQGVIEAYAEQPTAEEEAPAEAPAQAEVEAGYDEEEMAVEPAPSSAEPKRVIQTESKSVEMQFQAQISEMEIQFKAEKEEWSKQLAEVEAQRVALSAEVEELKSKLAEEPATQPLKHSVEGKSSQKMMFQTRSWKETTQDRVYKRMYNK